MSDLQYLGYYQRIQAFSTTDGQRIRMVTLYLAIDGPNVGTVEMVITSTNVLTGRLESRVTIQVN